MKKIVSFSAGLILSLLAYNASAQTQQWWDNNGTSAATGGTWDTSSSFWAPSATLTASTVPFANNNFAIFTAGSTTITALTITVPGAVTCEGIGNGTTDAGASSGAQVTTLTFSGGGSINLPSGTWSFECGSATANNMVISVPITGSGGIIQHNEGSLSLDANNTYSGGTTMTGGQIIYFNNNNSFGTGTVNITSTPGSSLLNTLGSLVTLPNAFSINNGGQILNFGQGNVTCTGPWTLLATPQLKNNAGSTTLTISGAISGAFGLDMLCDNTGAQITLSGPNTYTGVTSIGLNGAGATTIVNVSSINSVTTPAPQASSSLGKPSSVANGTIAMGYTTIAGEMIYTGSGETSDRVINLAGTTGGAIIEMDGTGPLVLTSAFTATGAGAKTLTLQGSSTAANTISGAIVNSSSATSLTKAQAGTWVLSGANTFTGNTTISAGTLTIGGAGKWGGGTYAGTISDAGVFNFSSSSPQSFTGIISGAGAITDAGSGVLTLLASNSITGTTTISASSGGLQLGNGTTKDGTITGAISIGATGLLVYDPGYGSVTNSKVLSGAGNVTKNGPADLTISGNANTFAGIPSVVINGGSVTTGGDGATPGASGNFGAVPGSFTYNDIVLNGGTLRGNNASFLFHANRGILLTSSSSVSSLTNCTTIIQGAISDGGNGYGLTMTATTPVVGGKAGQVTLEGVNTYSGSTTISGGILSLIQNGAISNSSSLVIGSGGTFDVSALTSGSPNGYFTLSSATSLTASGTGLGTSVPTTAAVINGNPTNYINLGTQTLNLNITPTNNTGDELQPALYIAEGTLVLNGNTINVVNNGPALGYGAYTLIQQAFGNIISNAVALTFNGVTGSGMVSTAQAYLTVVGGALVLNVVPNPSGADTTTGYFNNWTPYPPTTTYGTTSLVVSGTVSNASGGVATSADTITVQLQGSSAVTATIGANGSYSATLTIPGTLKPGYYVITNTLAPGANGPSTLGATPATDSSTALFITTAPLTITANSPTETYGTLTAGYSGAGSTQFVPTGLQNGETVGSVTMTQFMSPVVGGAPPANTTNSWTGTYTVMPGAATGGTFSAANYTITYVAGVLTISPASLTITAADGSSTYGTAYSQLGVGLTTNESPAAPLFTASAMQNGQSSDSIVLTLTSTGGPPSSPATTYSIVPSAAGPNANAAFAYDKTNFNAANYSIAYDNGTLTVNPLPVILTGTEPYSGSPSAPYTVLSVVNPVGSDVVTVAGGPPVTLAGSSVSATPWPITAGISSLTLGGAAAANYTVGGSASGSVTITNSYPAITIASGTLVATGLQVCWPTEPGVSYNVLTNGIMINGAAPSWVLDTAVSPYTGDGNTDCIIIPSASLPSTNIFVLIQQTEY